MNSQQARVLISETFQQTFDKGRFRNFAINLLNHIDETKASAWNTTYVKDAFKAHVKGYERLGTYTSPDKEKLDVLIVHLTTGSKIERARTAIRNFVADHLKTRNNKDAALVAFVSPTEKQWRFSYVKMEYAAVENQDGKVGIQTKLTPARRSSYIVGEGESCHTAQSRFLNLLQDTENHPTLAQIEDAFSVEAVTKEFFEQYKTLFLDFKDALDDLAKKDKIIGAEFAAKKISTADFAKKLMGQIVFLYFLQKKGWLGVPKGGDWGAGPHNFLRLLFGGTFRAHNHFFNDILEPLFYDTLATDRGHEAWCKTFNCRIPFLNGGLFEPLRNYDWQKANIIIPNSLFSNTKTTKAGDTGTGILDVFDRYNFTVNEAEPLEMEVAIDPEMLGKVFENLLDVKERKSKGSFYSPREIVHYMCQESLINYLDTALNTDKEIVPRKDIETFIYLGEQISHYEAVDAKYPIKMPASIAKHARLIDDKLAAITVCDPAIGSGAFPVGMMQEIVRARSALTPYFNDTHERTAYHFKRHAIQNCLYGVDIDPGAVEIAKLRLWLSLVVDEDDVKQIKPLPNLDYKIVVGNSLMGFPFKSQRQSEVEKLKLKFFDEPDHDIKAKLKQQIDDELSACFAAAKRSLGYEVTFDFEVWFSEVFDRSGGYDVVIANPPYVRQEEIKELKPILQSQFQCYTGTADLLVYFYERGVKLLRGGGTIALITSNKFYRAGYGEKLRGFLARELTLHRLIDFGDAPVFQAIAYASILVGVRTAPAKDASVLAYTWQKEVTFERIAQIVSERGQHILQSELKPDGWRLEPPAVLRLLEKLSLAGKPLREFVGARVSRGLTTGLNEAFVVDRATRDRLIREHPSSAEILRPFMRGKDIDRWRAEFADQFVVKIESSENKSHSWSGKSEKDAERLFAKTFPAIHSYFENFRSELIKRDDQGKYFWEQRSCKYWQEFEIPKIVSTKISIRPTFALDSERRYLGNTAYFFPAATSGNFLLGLLNSSLFFIYAKKVFVEKQGGWFEVQPDGLEAFPIPAVPTEKQKPVERLVAQILAAKQRDAKADVSTLEREIDELVYALYGLTEDEKTLVQATAK